MDLIKLLPNRTWAAIKLHASYMGLEYNVGVHEYVSADLSVLLEDFPIAYYWMGFLAADGSFSGNRLKLSLANKDRNHVIRFAQFIKCRNHQQAKDTSYSVSVQDSFTIPKIIEKYDLKKSKTYNPPDISWMQRDMFFSFFIGFVDGDGCIGKQSGRNDCQLRIKNHASWISVLQHMVDMISTETNISLPNAKINAAGYAQMAISNSVVLKWLKEQSKELPVLARKWDMINETVVSRVEQAVHNRNRVLELNAMNIKNVEISRITGLSQAAVSVIIKKSRK